MATPEINPSPKTRFLANRDFVAAHHNLISSPEFHRGVDYAMLEMQRREASADPQTTQDAMGRYYELRGAVEFIKILRALAHTDLPATKPVDRDNLATQR